MDTELPTRVTAPDQNTDRKERKKHIEAINSVIDTESHMMWALHRACQEGNLILVSVLLERGLNVNSKDSTGRTPLHIASEIGDKLLAELLFQRGADTCAVCARGSIPLDCCRDDEMSLMLVQMMSRAGKAELAKERLQFKDLSEKARQKVAEELDLKRSKKSPPILLPQFLSKRTLANLLGIKEVDSRLSSLSNVSDSSRCSETESGLSEMDKSLDSTSMESFQTNESISSGFVSVDELSSESFDRRATTALTKQEFATLNRSPFMLRRSRAVSEPPPPPKRTIKRSSTWNMPSKSTSTFIRPALNRRVEKRVTFPADIMLDMAIKNDDLVEACNLIKSRKVDLNRVGCNGLTPLHRAAIEGSYECLQLLVDLGANVNSRDPLAWTPLHDAVFHGHVSCALVLINAGADLSAETDDYMTILDMVETDRMLLAVGRAMIVTNSDEYKDTLRFFEQEVFEPVFDPDRETCV